MNNILFVDDDPGIINGLRRMLRPMRKEWNMHFVECGEEALNITLEQPIDIIVSDVRMPGMNGVELLAKVKEDHPDIIRIALSGHADTELQLESAKVLHQFIAKPVSADNLKLIITRALALRELLSSTQLRAIVTEATSLPSLPDLYNRVVKEASSPDGTLISIGKIIEQDPAMSAKILQLVNSAFFGLPRKIASIEEATTILGLDIVRSLVITIKVFEQFQDIQAIGFDLEGLIQYSQKTATLAKQIAKQQQLDSKEADMAFMAGMLHELGKLVLATAYTPEYKRVIELAGDDMEDWAVETEIFGTSHAEIGAYLLGIWSLPGQVVDAVAYHHNEHALHDGFSPTTALYAAISILKNSGQQLDQYYDKELINEWCELANQAA